MGQCKKTVVSYANNKRGKRKDVVKRERHAYGEKRRQVDGDGEEVEEGGANACKGECVGC